MQTVTVAGISIRLESVTGEVLSTEKRFETHVSAHGGGGSVGPHGGYVAPPEIMSRSIEQHELWIRRDDGVEEAFALVDAKIPLRTGQRISMIRLAAEITAPEQRGKWLAVALVNHSAGIATRTASNAFIANSLGLTPPVHAKGMFFLGLITSGMATTKLIQSSILVVLGLALAAFGAYRGYKASEAYPGRQSGVGALVDKAIAQLSQATTKP